MKNPYELARQVKGETEDEVFDELFQLVKKDGTWLTEIVQMYVANMTDDIIHIKQTVKLYENPSLLYGPDEQKPQ